MHNSLYALALVLVAASVTALLRFLPFWVFDGRRSIPKVVRYLGSVLPYAIMAMLVVYCLKDVPSSDPAGFLPALLAVAVVVGLHIWKRNTLVSIIGGTVCYMVLLRIMM